MIEQFMGPNILRNLRPEEEVSVFKKLPEL